MKLVPATGSLMNTNDFGCPEVASGPTEENVTSLRKRPWLSRKRFVFVFRAMWFPSARVCADSETATALNGTPVTTFPPCMPSKPSNSIRSPIMPASGPRACGIAMGGGGRGGACCTLANPALSMKIPLRTILIHTLRFIFPSPLLSRTAANFLLRRFQPFLLSTGSAESSKKSIGHHRAPLFSLFPRAPLSPSFCTPPEFDTRRPCHHYRGNLTASGNPSFPTRRSTWIHSPARSSFTGKPNAPRAPRWMRTRKISASPVSAGKAPGSSVKSLISLSAISVPDSAESEFRTAAALCTGVSWPVPAFALMAGVFAAVSGDFRWFAVSSGPLFRQFLQLTAAASTAAAASAHAAATATRRAFNVTCCVRNSWRKRISTRAGACTMAVSSASARSSTPAARQESCSAAHRAHVPACSRAATRSTSLNEASRSASNPIASNSSHVISCFLCTAQNPSSPRARATGHVPKHFQLGHQQSTSAMQPRTNRPNRASGHLRRFLVTHFFQFAQHHRLAKLHGQFLHRGPHLRPAFAFFPPHRRRRRVLQNNSAARAVFVFYFERYFPRQSFQVFHHAVARHSVKERSERSACRVILFRSAHQGHEHVLHNLFRGPGVSRHAQRKAVHGRLVPPVEERECLLIALGGPPQQNVVSLLLGDPHVS